MPIEELPPEWHGAKAIPEYARRRDVRDRKEATICLEIVEP